MTQIKSILVALGREGDPVAVLRRSVMLARRFNASIEIFLCEAERAYALQHQYDVGNSDAVRRASLTKLRAWMERMWSFLDVNDVAVTMEAVYETPLCEAISRKVKHSKPDLVIRGIGANGVSTFSVADLDLARSCSAPLLLTRGKPWRSTLSVAAALDISGEESPELIHAILRAAKTVAAGCGASLEVLYASPFDSAAADAVKAHRESLCSYAASAGVRPDQVHIVMGDPVRSIPEFVAQQCYELLVLGALTHRKTMTALVGTLTGRLIESVRCDLLLVSCSRP